MTSNRMKIHSSFTPAVPNLYDWLASVEHKEDILKNTYGES